MRKNIYYKIIIVVIIIFLCSLLYFIIYKEGFQSNNKTNNVEIIVARYNEDLKWLDTDPFNQYSVIVYNKGNNSNYIKSSNIIKEENIKNVGRESHTYLYHIINNYDNLSDVTVFLPGSVDLEHKYNRSVNMLNKVKETNSTVFSGNFNQHGGIEDIYDFKLEKYISTNENNKKNNSDDNIKLSNRRPYGNWYNSIFTNGEKNNCIAWNGIISISKNDILKKPKSYYEKIIKEVDDHHNPETGHFIERSWYAIFYPYNETVMFTN